MHRMLNRVLVLAAFSAVTALAAPADVGGGLVGHWTFDEGGGDVAIDASGNGNPISRRTLDLLVKQYGEAAGIVKEKRHFHVLRHTGITHWLEATGGNRPLVQDRAGHTRPDSTDVYTHFTDAYRDEVSREAYASGKLVIA